MLSVILVAISATTLQGQRIVPGRFANAVAGRPVGIGTVVITRPRTDPPAAPKLGGQVLAGLGGMVVGFFAGGFVASQGAQSDGLGAVGAAMGPIVAGAALGSAIGVQWHGKRHGVRSPFLPTLGGAVLGLLPFPVAPLTSPLGAALVYNRLRQERVDP